MATKAKNRKEMISNMIFPYQILIGLSIGKE
jgi:hypothetical protein